MRNTILFVAFVVVLVVRPAHPTERVPPVVVADATVVVVATACVVVVLPAQPDRTCPRKKLFYYMAP